MEEKNIPLDREKGFSIEFNIGRFIDAQILHEVEKEDESAAKMMRIFMRRGLSAQQATEILMELVILFQEEIE